MDQTQLRSQADFLWALINLHKDEEHLNEMDVVLILRSGAIENSTANMEVRYSGVAQEALRTTTKVASELMAVVTKGAAL